MTSLCPTCQSSLPEDSVHTWFPFCSERCKLIDLGGWLNEDYRITGNGLADSGDEETEN